MKTKSQTMAIPTTNEDIMALKHVHNFLEKIQKAYDKEDVLMSPEDGEVIRVEELGRVRGILSFLYNNPTVDVNP